MKALLVIDMQNDFMPGGALAVPDGDQVIPYINKLAKEFSLVVATQDWHPKDHISFASRHEGKKPFDTIDLDGQKETLWPDHCVQGTTGAEFHSKINSDRFEAIFRKGTNPALDSYSGFYDNRHAKATGLSGYLEEKEIDTLHIVGVAADFCVYYSIMDAIQEAYKVVLHLKGTKAIDSENFKIQLEALKQNKNFLIKD